jgi:hypothetical protein
MGIFDRNTSARLIEFSHVEYGEVFNSKLLHYLPLIKTRSDILEVNS